MLLELPADGVRCTMWGFADDNDLQQLVQAARHVARGRVAALVAGGQRATYEWTAEKDQLLSDLDQMGVTRVLAAPGTGKAFADRPNLAMALAAFELAWVDGGAASCLVALGLALQPIFAMGTDTQKQTYADACLPSADDPERTPWRGAFCLTEPLPFAGVDTGVLSGTVRICDWPAAGEPILHVHKAGRFTNNMDFANFVVVAVASDDARIEGSCMILLHEDDAGEFDRGSATRKLVHQLTSTRDPKFDLRVPASRIVGGYEIHDGKIVPRWNHGKILEAVFARTRVPAGVMTGAKLLSSVEPIIRYQRERFRGAVGAPGTPRHDLGLQTKEDALHRLIDIWAAGEAACSLGFATARHFDSYTQLAAERESIFAAEKIASSRAAHRLPREAEQMGIEFLNLSVLPEDDLSDAERTRLAELQASRVVELVVKQSVARVLSPATKLWNTGYGAGMLRQAVSLMGGHGITDDCPGFLPQKWMDAQLEATYEGPESVQRRQLVVTLTSELFLAQFRRWLVEMGRIASDRPGTGACTVATAMRLWLWTLHHMQHATDADGRPLYRDHRQGATFPMADALCWLLASYHQIEDVVRLETDGAGQPALTESLPGTVAFLTDLCHVQAARAAGEVARICSELVFGYARHPGWETQCGQCVKAHELDLLEGLIPGISVGARLAGDVIEEDGSHAPKAGPCVRFEGLQKFNEQRAKLDGCLTGARLAKDCAARALTQVAIPDKLDYPQ